MCVHLNQSVALSFSRPGLALLIFVRRLPTESLCLSSSSAVYECMDAILHGEPESM